MRGFGALLAVMAMLAALTGCDRLGVKSPLDPSLPSASIGLRVDDGRLEIWTGAPCLGVTEVNLRFNRQRADEAELQLYTPTPESGGITPGAEVEHVIVGGPYPHFVVTKDLPPGFDWRAAETLEFAVGGPATAGREEVDLGPAVDGLIADSPKHPEAYWFPDFGWLTPDEVRAGDRHEFLTLCAPDPANEEQSRQLLFGVRADTEGALRIWTPATCRGVEAVIVTFQPGQADLVLEAKRGTKGQLEDLTLGGPYPDFDVTTALPSGFDWRTASSVMLRVDGDGGGWGVTTELAQVVADSATHPEDVYWFQGFGWLGPSDVDQQDPAAFHPICGT